MKNAVHRESVVIRFAGDSGDGMQITGSQFTNTTAVVGNDLATLPDFPAEIRAPAGTRAGVSGFQLHFSSNEIYTPGDAPEVLVAMNPAALVTNLRDLASGGIIIVNEDKFEPRELEKAELKSNPLEDGSLDAWRVIRVPLGRLTKDAVAGLGLNAKETDRCKNLFALGITYWMFNRPLDTTARWIDAKFKEPYREANHKALQAGWNFAETAEFFHEVVEVLPARLAPGTYRNITGNAALALGLATAGRKAGLPVFYGSYPITPASDVLHSLSRYKHLGVATFQAEDEIAAVCAAIGASFGGALGVTGTSGPGLALKGEAIGLAIMTELPLVVLDVQRAGPSTGLPTKTEQSDLLFAMYGRNGEAPLPIVAAATPSDCFQAALDACRIALESMTPVLLLTDGYLGNGAEPWAIPDPDGIPPIAHRRVDQPNADGAFLPYLRDADTLARPWAVPGTPGLEHRIGGLEKQENTGAVSYDAANHQRMSELRREKVARVAERLPLQEVDGPESGDLVVVSWGSTYGAVRQGVHRARARGQSVAHVHLRFLNPFPRNLGDILARYRKVLVPEMNLGQLVHLLRARFLVDARSLAKIEGLPFKVREVVAGIDAVLAEIDA